MATGAPIATGWRFAGRHIRDDDDDDVPRRLPPDRHCRIGRRSAPSFDARRACACAGAAEARGSRSPMVWWLGRSKPPGIPCCCCPMLFSRCMFEPRVGKLLENRATSQQPAAQPRRIRQHLVREGRTMSMLLRLEKTVEFHNQIYALRRFQCKIYALRRFQREIYALRRFHNQIYALRRFQCKIYALRRLQREIYALRRFQREIYALRRFHCKIYALRRFQREIYALRRFHCKIYALLLRLTISPARSRFFCPRPLSHSPC
jgi:hypothetical protein